MPDRFGKQGTGLDSPMKDAFAVTPNDSTVFAQPTRAVYVGTKGNLRVQMLSTDNANTVVTLTSVQAGTMLNIRVNKILSTNTNAGNIIGFY